MPSSCVSKFAWACHLRGRAYLFGAAHEIGQALQNAHVAGAAVLLQGSVAGLGRSEPCQLQRSCLYGNNLSHQSACNKCQQMV